MTTKGRGGGFFNTLKPIEGSGQKNNIKVLNFEEDDLNDISMIRGDSQGVGQARFLDEESFNQELLLIKLETQQPAIKNNQTISTNGNSNSNTKKPQKLFSNFNLSNNNLQLIQPLTMQRAVILCSQMTISREKKVSVLNKNSSSKKTIKLQ